MVVSVLLWVVTMMALTLEAILVGALGQRSASADSWQTDL